MYKCKLCEYQTDTSNEVANHYKYNHKKEEKFICNTCERIFKNKGGLSCHVKKCKGKPIDRTCPKCNIFIKSNYSKHLNYCDGRGPRRKREKQGYGWSKGLTKETDSRVKNISEAAKGKSRNYKYKHTQETKILLSNLMKERYNNGWEVKAGRCKKFDYDSPIAGKIKVDGTWELKVAKYLDGLGVIWYRNKLRFKYFNKIKNKDATYCPDFFVKDWNLFIEVKGYKTELDKIKWEQFEHNLEIWDKEKLESMGIDVKYKK